MTALTWWILSLSARRSKRIRSSIRAPLESYRAGDFEGALTAADSIVGVGGEVEHLYIRSGILRQLGRLAEAETALVRCVELSEQSECEVYGRRVQGDIAQMKSRIRLASGAQEMLCSMLPAFVFEAHPVIPVEDAVRGELEVIAWRDGLKGK
jgi:hypothetical protein